MPPKEGEREEAALPWKNATAPPAGLLTRLLLPLLLLLVSPMFWLPLLPALSL